MVAKKKKNKVGRPKNPNKKSVFSFAISQEAVKKLESAKLRSQLVSNLIEFCPPEWITTHNHNPNIMIYLLASWKPRP